MKLQDLKTIEELREFTLTSNERKYYEVDPCYPYNVSLLTSPVLFYRFYDISTNIEWGDLSSNSTSAHDIPLFDNKDEAEEYSKQKKIEYLENELKKVRGEQ